MIDKKLFEQMRSELELFDAQREDLIKTSRDVLKASKAAIYSLHRNEIKTAQRQLKDAKDAIDKINALNELGFKFYKAKKINTLMVSGAALNVECKLVKTIELGSHTMFIGEVIEAAANKDKEPLAYHQGKYWVMEKNIEKPSPEEMKKIKKAVENASK